MALKNFLIAALAATASASPTSVYQKRQTTQFENFLRNQRALSLRYAIANIGGTNNSVVANGPDYNPGPPAAGAVVASPSTYNPDYFYTWSRDSALTMIMLADEQYFGTYMDGNNSLSTILDDYVSSQAVLQTITNPSGTFYPAGQGLGEPKFYSNLTRFDSTWGRPQNDGPALRATTIMEYMDYLYREDSTCLDSLAEMYWPLVLNDLKYVAQYWNTSSYDLWEEVNGNSFFTTTAQFRSLVEGARWADLLGEPCVACREAPNILCFLQTSFWNQTGGYILANINANQVTRTQLGVDPLLAAMHVFDINAPCDAAATQPCNSKIFATHKAITDAFRTLYPINKNASAPTAVLMGRYPEDTYYGGNPWYICTYAAAEVLYDAVAQMKKQGQYTVDNYSLPFFRDLYPQATEGVLSGQNLTHIANLVTQYADGFMNITQQYISPNGSMSEQINKTTGEQLSASALTWSFASFITAAQRRAAQYPPSWGASTVYANVYPSTCPAFSSTNSTFTYTPAVAAGAPATPQTYSSASGCLTQIFFQCNFNSTFGQNVYIVGNNPLLSSGNGSSSIGNVANIILPLRTNFLSATNTTWFADLYFPAGQSVTYSYALQNGTQGYIFDSNTYNASAPACGGGIRYTNDTANFPGSGR